MPKIPQGLATRWREAGARFDSGVTPPMTALQVEAGALADGVSATVVYTNPSLGESGALIDSLSATVTSPTTLAGLKTKLWINVPAYTYYNTNYGPINLVVGANSFGDGIFVFMKQDGSGPSNVDSSGNPTDSDFAFRIRVGPNYVGTYACSGTYTGHGTLTLHTGNGASSFSTSYNSGTNVTSFSFTFDPAYSNQAPIFWVTGASGGITNLDVRRTSDVGNGNVWQSEFITQYADFAGFRFMDAQSTNNDLSTTTWASRLKNYDYISIEQMVALCNQAGKNGWWCVPGFATNDWVSGFCTYVDANLTGGLFAAVENGNEWFNYNTNVHDVAIYSTNAELHAATGAKFSYDSPWSAASASRTSNVVTVTLASPLSRFRLTSGSKVMLTGFGGITDKTSVEITSRADDLTLTFASTGADGALTLTNAGVWFMTSAVLGSKPQGFLTAHRSSDYTTLEMTYVSPLTVGENIKLTGASFGGATSQVSGKTTTANTSTITFHDPGPDGYFDRVDPNDSTHHLDGPSGVDGYYIESTDVSSTLNSYPQYETNSLAWRVRRCCDVSMYLRTVVGNSKTMTRFKPVYMGQQISALNFELAWMDAYVNAHYTTSGTAGTGAHVKDTIYAAGMASYAGMNCSTFGFAGPPVGNAAYGLYDMGDHNTLPAYTEAQYAGMYEWQLVNMYQVNYFSLMTLALWYGIKVAFYEGGIESADLNATTDDKINKNNARQDSIVGTAMLQFFNDLGKYLCEFFCFYNGDTTGAQLGAADRYVYGFTDRIANVTPIWQAVKDFNAQTSTPPYQPLATLPAVTTINTGFQSVGWHGRYPENGYASVAVTGHAGTYTCFLECSNATGSDKHAAVYVDGTLQVASITAPPTADIFTFTKVGPITLTLPEGTCAIRFVDLDSLSGSGQVGMNNMTFGVPTLANAPTNLTHGAVTSSSIALSWTAPTSGDPITDYLVQYSTNGGATWSTFSHTASPATSITITGLSASTTYTTQVSAINDAGTGPSSKTDTATTSAAASPQITLVSRSSTLGSHDFVSEGYTDGMIFGAPSNGHADYEFVGGTRLPRSATLTGVTRQNSNGPGSGSFTFTPSTFGKTIDNTQHPSSPYSDLCAEFATTGSATDKARLPIVADPNLHRLVVQVYCIGAYTGTFPILTLSLADSSASPLTLSHTRNNTYQWEAEEIVIDFAAGSTTTLNFDFTGSVSGNIDAYGISLMLVK